MRALSLLHVVIASVSNIHPVLGVGSGHARDTVRRAQGDYVLFSRVLYQLEGFIYL